MTEFTTLLAGQLLDIQAGWSIGSFGAIGEFHQRADDTILSDGADALLRVTEKGGIRINSENLAASRCLAYETLSSNPRRWSSEVIFCLPEDQGRMNGRTVVTELGADTHALKTEDRSGILFDMGLSLAHVDFCVRTCDPTLIAALRQSEGVSIFDPENGAMGAILKAHPHRVVISKLGRVEIFQKIGGAETGGVSPDGPHTHVLPKLIKSGRTHSSNTPVPEGHFPCLYLHPANPVMGPDGKDIPFQWDRYDAFQAILERHGDPSLRRAKQSVRSAVEANELPSDFDLPETREGRRAVRIALRQLRLEAKYEGDLLKEKTVKVWQQLFDPNVSEKQDHSELYQHATGHD